MNKYKFAVIGVGFIGQKQIKLIEESNEAEIVALVDTDKAKCILLRETVSFPVYESVDELFKHHQDLDLVSVCTPNDSHVQLVKDCIRKNVHVLCEKPLGLTAEECYGLDELSKVTGKEVFCVMQNRYSPPSALLKGIVQNGLLGKLHRVHINCFWNRDERYYLPNGKKHSWKGTVERDGGPLYTQFSHFIDLMIWLFGDLELTHAQFSNHNHKDVTEFEDSGFFSFNVNKGGEGLFHYTTSVWERNMESSIAIIGEKGSIKVSGQYMNKISYCHIDGYELPEIAETNSPNDYGVFKGSAANHSYVIDNVIKTLNGEDRPDMTLAEGIKVVEFIEEVYKTRKI